MAERTIYTCDVCGKEMPEDGIVMVIQHSVTYEEKGWDLCDRCHKRILTYIHDITKEE
jgi:DNA-directed RNA polymerase subunit RPC12/RpoP